MTFNFLVKVSKENPIVNLLKRQADTPLFEY
jgi:hypothetical protein